MKRITIFLIIIFLLFFLTSCPELANKPPLKPFSPVPANGADDQPKNITLTWECSDPEGDTITYERTIYIMERET